MSVAESTMARQRSNQGADELALSMRGLTAQFGGITALDHLDTDVPKHQVVAVIGPNGAGKTTLLNALCGLIPASADHCMFLGRPLLDLAPAERARNGIGRSFQAPRLLEAESLVTNLLCGVHNRIGYSAASQLLRPWATRRAEIAARKHAMSILERVGLKDVADTPVIHLPYGPRKVIDIARALMSSPELLLLDEPSSGLDVDEQLVVQHLLESIRDDRAVTVLVVEHRMDLVRAVADRVIGLQSGRTLCEGTPEEVLDSTEFRTALTGQREAGATAS